MELSERHYLREAAQLERFDGFFEGSEPIFSITDQTCTLSELARELSIYRPGTPSFSDGFARLAREEVLRNFFSGATIITKFDLMNFKYKELTKIEMDNVIYVMKLRESTSIMGLKNGLQPFLTFQSKQDLPQYLQIMIQFGFKTFTLRSLILTILILTFEMQLIL